MKLYVGLDVSMESTSICVVDQDGTVVRETKTDSDPHAIATALKEWDGRIERVGLEAQSLSPWLSVELIALGLPAIVVESVHMQKALSAQRNKTDRNDARGIAQMMRTGWFRAVHVKSAESLQLRFLLSGRRLLKSKFIDVENELRGALKAFGMVIGTVSRGRLEARTLAVIDGAPPVIVAIVKTLLGVRRTLIHEYDQLHSELVRYVRGDEVCRRFMTVPGVGPVTALAFKTSVDDPTRFRRSRTVGAHFGLTPKRVQSGTIDYSGRISRCGDPEVRTALYGAASSMLVRCKKWSSLRAWGMSIAKRRGHKKAVVAVARKLATVLHTMWRDGSEFRWSTADVQLDGAVAA
jgi:transposase